MPRAAESIAMVGKVVVLAIAFGCSPPPPVVAPTPPEPAPEPAPVAVVPADAPPPPPLAITPYLVDALPPLGDKHGNPDRHEPSVATPSQVTMVKTEDGQERVRVRRSDDEMDRNWTATFVDAAGKHVGDCKIVAWDATALECTTTVALPKLTADVVLEPPTREHQIKQVLLAQAQGNELLVTFAAGVNDDVGDDWKATLVDDNGAAVPKGSCKIVRVSDTTSTCRTPAKVDRLWGVLATRP